jgi:putative glutamine amidotransferase
MSPRIGITTSPGTNADRPADVLNRAYIDAVVAAGGLPIVIPMLDPSLAGSMLASVDALVLSGGGDVDPARYGQQPVPEVAGVDRRRDTWELAIVRAALRRGTPVLGICRGAQVLNVACGGTLVQDLPSISEHPHRASDRWGEVVHLVEVDPASKLADVVDVLTVGANTLHHQAVAEVGAGLCAVAWAHDGTVEAVEADDARAVLGVQWHPELLTEHEPHRALFTWIVEQGARRASATIADVIERDGDDALAVA